MSESDDPTEQVDVSLPDETEIVEVSDSNNGKVAVEILGLLFEFEGITDETDNVDLKILSDGNTLAETRDCPDWFWKSTSGMGQLRNEVGYNGDDTEIEIKFESALDLLPEVYREIIQNDELNLEVSGKKGSIEGIREILDSIVPVSTDEETEFRFRLDPDHPDVLSSKRPIATMSVSAWASDNPEAFEKTFVDASSGGFHPELTDEDENVEYQIIQRVKSFLEPEAEDTRPVEERILDDLEDHINRTVSTVDHLTPLNDAAPGPDYFVDDIDGPDDDPIIWIPRNVILGDHLDEITSSDVHQTMADIETPAIQRSLFESNKKEISPNNYNLRAYPVRSGRVGRREMAIAVLESSGRLPEFDDDNEGGDN